MDIGSRGRASPPLEGEKIKRGCFCGVIQKQLIVAKCPLPQGACMWKHRITGQCRYSDKELSPIQFCDRVGLRRDYCEQIPALREEILNVVKEALAR